MKWIQEPDRSNPALVHHVLALESGEPLQPAFIEFWQRILSDGCSSAATSDWMSLGIDIAARSVDADEYGEMVAGFRNGLRRACSGLGNYFVRTDAFACLQAPGEDDDTFYRKQIRWYLEQYTLLKEAAQTAEVQRLLEKINDLRPLSIRAATANGWFDLQVGEASFGLLPTEDQELLLGMDPAPVKPLKNLMAGVIDLDTRDVVQELAEALIAYTPSHFETICCEITEGVEQGQRALFYNIQCPQFPDDGTTVANERVHRAATRLVLQMAPVNGTFPGIAMKLVKQENGSWRNSLTLMSDGAD